MPKQVKFQHLDYEEKGIQPTDIIVIQILVKLRFSFQQIFTFTDFFRKLEMHRQGARKWTE